MDAGTNAGVQRLMLAFAMTRRLLRAYIPHTYSNKALYCTTAISLLPSVWLVSQSGTRFSTSDVRGDRQGLL